MTLKAIETQYNGYRFRSRLEARWAVFFDALNVSYQYEAEGYDLGDTGWYLPDFWVPHLFGEGRGAFVEIKGVEPTEEECAKAAALSDATDQFVALFYGHIGPPSIVLEGPNNVPRLLDGAVAYLYTPPGKGSGPRPDFLPRHDPRMMSIQEDSDGDLDMWPVYVDETPFREVRYQLPTKALCHGGSVMPIVYSGNGRKATGPKLRAAYKAARSARFEHGEKGTS